MHNRIPRNINPATSISHAVMDTSAPRSVSDIALLHPASDTGVVTILLEVVLECRQKGQSIPLAHQSERGIFLSSVLCKLPRRAVVLCALNSQLNSNDR